MRLLGVVTVAVLGGCARLVAPPIADDDIDDVEADSGVESGAEVEDHQPSNEAPSVTGTGKQPPPPSPSKKPDTSVIDASDNDASRDASKDGPLTTSDSGTDGGGCVDWVDAPVSPMWRGSASYTVGLASSAVPFYCPSVPDANSCKSNLISRGAKETPYGYRLTPLPGVCHVEVPTKCLPCMDGQTQW